MEAELRTGQDLPASLSHGPLQLPDPEVLRVHVVADRDVLRREPDDLTVAAHRRARPYRLARDLVARLDVLADLDPVRAVLEHGPGRQFGLRDRHVVRGGKQPYEGETIYGWDARQKKVVYTYWASDGGISTGSLERVDGGLMFAEAYAGGWTPSPCVGCNTFMKFGDLLKRARAVGAGRVATGHYAILERDPRTDRTLLRRAADEDKDLGTGKPDGGFGVEFDKTLGRFILFGEASFTFMGDPPNQNFRDRPAAGLGVGYKVSASVTVVTLVDWRRALVAGQSDPVELVGVATFKLTPRLSVSPNAAAARMAASSSQSTVAKHGRS